MYSAHAWTSWLRTNSGTILLWIVVAVSFSVSYLAFVQHQPFFAPDSRYYLAMTFLFGGDSPDIARDRTVEFASRYGIEIPPVDELFGWGLVQPRVMLPALAVPFVKIMGPLGLAATVLVVTIALEIALTLVLLRRYGAPPAAAVMIMINSSYYIMTFYGMMLTESLSSLWTVLALVGALGWMRDRNRSWLVLAVGATVGAAFTRQATFIVAGAFLVAWVIGSLLERRNSVWMWPAVLVAGTAVTCQIVQSLVFPSFSQLDQFLKQTGTDSLGEALLAVPGVILRILSRDAYTLMSGDRVLVTFILLAVISMIVFWRRPEAHLLLGAILATGLYNVTNGTPTQFRYALPGLVFFAIMVAYLVRRTGVAVRRRTMQRKPDPMS